MNYLMRKIQLGLFVVATMMFLFGCNLFNQVEDTIDGVAPSVYDVVPEDGSSMKAGTVVNISFKCDKRDAIRLSFRDENDDEIDYEMVYGTDGVFKRPFWVPLRASTVQVLVNNDEGSLYVKAQWKVTDRKPFGSFDIPKSYDKAYSYRTDEPYPIIDQIINDPALEKVRAENPLEYVTEVCERFNVEAGDDDFKKAKLIHDLLTKLIPYDMVGVKQNPMPPQDYWTVLSNKLGVCQGYAVCFNKFCEIIGLDSQYVYGWNRTGSHAWDIVRLDGECYLLDVTWDAGKEVDGDFKAVYSTKHLFQKPEYFKFLHYPENPEHQLLPASSRVKSRDDMIAMPQLEPEFFDSIVDPDTHVLTKLTGKVVPEKGRFTVPFKLQPEKNILFGISTNGKEGSEKHVVRYIPETDTYEGIYDFLEAGEYEGRVILLKDGASTGSVIARFKINVTETATETCISTYLPALSINLTDQTLVAGETYDFKVITSNADIEYARLGFYTEEAGSSYTVITLDKEEGKNLYSKSVTIPKTVTFSKGGDGYEANTPYKVTKARLIIKYYNEKEQKDKIVGCSDYYTVVDSE